MSENFDLDTGKNIVDALKNEENSANFENMENNTEENQFDSALENEEETRENFFQEDNTSYNSYEEDEMPDVNRFDLSMKPSSDFENNMIEETPHHAVVDKYANDLYNFEVPNNVAVLKKLIAKLPSGVTRQTGAQIIKQTMEALGISMKSVLQEAQQLQEQLSTSTKECQATISEYKRQIVTLEEQAQSYKKQYNNLNELVSLFIQTEN
ncbi:hypothetical protein IJG72_02240 [bacterium]|nr:hypothetical protein [bacterium]